MGRLARILVVDDDESIRKTITSILEEKGYAVDTAKNGKEAIQKSKAEFYNLALVDIRLPDMEGTKLLTAMRETTPRMIKIIVTGYPSLHNAIEAVNRGADAYILKPFNVEKTLKLIGEQLRRQKNARKLGEKRVTEFVETRVKELEEEKLMPRMKK